MIIIFDIPINSCRPKNQYETRIVHDNIIILVYTVYIIKTAHTYYYYNGQIYLLKFNRGVRVYKINIGLT